MHFAKERDLDSFLRAFLASRYVLSGSDQALTAPVPGYDGRAELLARQMFAAGREQRARALADQLSHLAILLEQRRLGYGVESCT